MVVVQGYMLYTFIDSNLHFSQQMNAFSNTSVMLRDMHVLELLLGGSVALRSAVCTEK